MAAACELTPYKPFPIPKSTEKERVFLAKYSEYYEVFNIAWPFYHILSEIASKGRGSVDEIKQQVLAVHQRLASLAYIETPKRLEVAIACGSSLFDYLFRRVQDAPRAESVAGFWYFISYKSDGSLDVDAVVHRLAKANAAELNKGNPIPLFCALQSIKVYTSNYTAENLATRVFHIIKPSHQEIFYLLTPAFFDTIAKAQSISFQGGASQVCCCSFM